MRGTQAANTHLGTRDNNEDSFVCDPANGLWFVADGVGGLALGEVASAICAHTLTTMISAGHGVNQSIETTHKRIREFADAEANGANMGSTLVLLLSRGGLYNVFWAGDCRAYLFDGNLTQITRDHSYLQALLDSGDLSEEDAREDPRRNGITKALGLLELTAVRADSISNRWKTGQQILLCSDGLSGCVDDLNIARILMSQASDQEKVDALVAEALSNGGTDNITVILVTPPATAYDLSNDDTEVPQDLDLNKFNEQSKRR